MPTTARPPAPGPARRRAAPTPRRGVDALAAQRARALAAWDAFRALAADADPDAPSRLPGWTGRDVVAHLASWPEEPLLDRLLAEARGPRLHRPRCPLDQDAANARPGRRAPRRVGGRPAGRARRGPGAPGRRFRRDHAAEGIGLAPTGSRSQDRSHC